MQTTAPPSDLAHADLTEGSTLTRLRFTNEAEAGGASFLLLDEADGRRAEVLERAPLADAAQMEQLDAAGQDLALVSVPAPIEEQAALALTLRSRLARRSDLGERDITLLNLQGAHLVHAPGWIVVIAVPERLEAAARSAVEVAFHERELREIERALDHGWGPARAAAPQAFQATAAGLERRGALSERFQELVSLRGRYAHLGPRIHVPQVYPPTLSSQVGERVRERLRILERHELVEASLAAQEQIYAMCGERVSELANARRGHALEWVIIALLAVQTLFWMIETLAGASAT